MFAMGSLSPTVEFRKSMDSPPRMVTLDELAQMVREGEAGPTTLVRDKMMTKSEWRTIDNLRLFHRHSPVSVPPGPHLQVLLDREAEQEPQRRLHRAERIELGAAVSDYRNGSSMARLFELLPLEDVLKSSGASWVSRLWRYPAFRPESVYTFARLPDMLEVRHDTSDSNLWNALISSPSSSVETYSKRGCVALEALPKDLAETTTHLERCQRSLDCLTRAVDGVFFRHQVLAKDVSLDATWSNPNRQDHPEQIALLDIYARCAELAGVEQPRGAVDLGGAAHSRQVSEDPSDLE